MWCLVRQMLAPHKIGSTDGTLWGEIPAWTSAFPEGEKSAGPVSPHLTSEAAMPSSRTSPYSSASPLEREVLMNNHNSSYAGDSRLADIKQQLLAEEPRTGSQATPLSSQPFREKSLIDGYSSHSRKGSALSEEPKRRDSRKPEPDSRLSSLSRSPSESKRTVDKQSSDDNDYRNSRLSSYAKEERKSSVDNYGRKSSSYASDWKTEPDDSDRRTSLLGEKHAPRKKSPLLTDSTSFKMDSIRGRIGEPADTKQPASSYRLFGSPDPSSRDSLRPPALGALRDFEGSRSQYSDYLGSHVDSDVSSIGHRSPLLRDKITARSDELLEEEEEEGDQERRPVAKETKKKRKRKYPVLANLSGTRYDI
ncbi:hypothetical protein CAPTEDRAFT_196477, partial [Capitella teleta]